MKEEPSSDTYMKTIFPCYEIGRYPVCVFLYYSLGFGLALPSGANID